MTLTLAVASALAKQCAPQVASTTMVAVVLNESALDPLVIGDNTSKRTYHSASRVDAETLAQALIARGHSIDMGIAQINSRTARAIGLSIRDAFDPCASMAAAGHLMVSTYRQVAATAASTRHAVAAMLSTYNTGDNVRGIENGYVARVYRAAVRAGAIPPSTTAGVTYRDLKKTARPGWNTLIAGDTVGTKAALAPWAVFGVSATSADVFPSMPQGR